ncbi:hypothetical protein B0H13DRAFT_2264068 [Mycena leptocephala]|nr:hypothetical protein B0H13DRAFT_2264068 [Mycena leptocephala]
MAGSGHLKTSSPVDLDGMPRWRIVPWSRWRNRPWNQAITFSLPLPVPCTLDFREGHSIDPGLCLPLTCTARPFSFFRCCTRSLDLRLVFFAEYKVPPNESGGKDSRSHESYAWGSVYLRNWTRAWMAASLITTFERSRAQCIERMAKNILRLLYHTYVKDWLKDKEEQTSNWKGDANGDITDEQKYAAIDAHASARLYEALAPALAKKAKIYKLVIPSSWYTFNGRYGMPVRTQQTIWNRDAPWSVADCTWFFGGKFQGYY